MQDTTGARGYTLWRRNLQHVWVGTGARIKVVKVTEGRENLRLGIVLMEEWVGGG